MKGPDGTFLWRTWIGATDARRVGGHGANLLGHHIRILAKTDGVVVALAHLLTIQARHPRSFGEQGLRLDQNQTAGTLQVAEQPLPVV